MMLFMANEKGDQDDVSPEIADLADALTFMKSDAARLLKELLRGISMWGITALLAFIMAGVWIALGEAILKYAHPFGSPPFALDILYASYLLAIASALMGIVLSWRFFWLRSRFGRLYKIAETLH